MLQIKNVRKVYKTGQLTQTALDGVSLSLRDSEFVAVLGQSGSGKTTLLNVIGGLDRYDEGDLIINGKSTKKYKSRDWDSYRNHSVGFVFQSYNLIPHQSVLSNVELALTIGGVSRRERVRRAKAALDAVGLSDHIHKKPSQLSGGQMQRVAIARALVNDPDILLADEPTGALDSETSIQVMDLLKEVAKDRLVVMVTHNPELAEKYATRIVKLKDGKIISDSDPFEPDGAEGEHRAGRSGMSYLTALNLSLKNLWTKKVRTFLIAIAGSIGIIGIAMILSMSNGANAYIRNIQEETLKSYPLQITKTSFNLASMITPKENGADDVPEDERPIKEWRTVTNMFSHVSTNDLSGLREYFEGDGSDVNKYVQAIEYDYNVTPQIYAIRDGKTRRVHPDTTFSALGFSTTDTMSSLMTSFSGTSSFFAMPSDPNLYVGQYDVKAGRWPEKYNECILMLTERGYVADLTLYTLGIKDPANLDEMVKAFAEGYATDVQDEARKYDYDEFLGITFKLVSPTDYYVYDEEHGVWADRSGDEKFMKALVESSEELTIVGVIQPSPDNKTPFMSTGIGYPAALTLHVIEKATNSDIVKAQLASKDTDVFTGTKFGDSYESTGFDLSSLFKIDEEALSKLMSFDIGTIDLSSIPFDVGSFDIGSLDMSGIDLSGIDLSELIDPAELGGTVPDIDLKSLLQYVKINATEKDVRNLFEELVSGFLAYSAGDPSTDFAKLPQSIAEFLGSDEARITLSDEVRAALAENGAKMITAEDLAAILGDVMSGFPEYVEGRQGDGADVPTLLSDFLNSEEVKEKIESSSDYLRERLKAFTLSDEQAKGVTEALYSAYKDFAAKKELPTPDTVRTALASYLSGDGAKEIIANSISSVVDTSELESKIGELFSDTAKGASEKLSGAIAKAFGEVASKYSDTVSSSISDALSGITDKIKSSFEFSPETLASVFSVTMSPEELRDIMTSVFTGEVGSYETNLKKLGYADTDDPSMITIFPVDFAGKTAVKDIIDRYNDRMTLEGKEESVIVYTDLVDALMGSVTDIISAVSGVLIAFVAISLVVSSVMIGVITYISVLERKKEIGILRSIGASRHNISSVFNAETFIIGTLAGLLGVAITLLLIIPTNVIIHSLTGQNDINAMLPPAAGGILVLLSIVLTMLGGLIPSRKAAKSDPVEALRSE